MKKGDKIAIVCCSNGQPVSNREKLCKLHTTIQEIGLVPVWSHYIYTRDSVFSGSAKERAQSLMDFYMDQEIKAIFDISGGDIANEILPYLNFQVIAESEKSFWGYSDLTTILNAIYSKTGKPSVLYQIRNLIREDGKNQIHNFKKTIIDGEQTLFDFRHVFLQGKEMQGIVVGGNIRCLLKLAGTEYWPDMPGKILLLEAYSGGVPQMVTYLNQLKQIGVFEQVSGILLGTFTQMEKENLVPEITDLVKRYAGEKIPIAYTPEIGHGANSKGIIIGEKITLDSDRLGRMKLKTVEGINILGSFCGKRDVEKLTQQDLLDKYGFGQADVMILFGGSILYGGDVLAKAMKEQVAKTYIIVGGEGHTTESLRLRVQQEYPDIDTSGKAEAEVFSEYIYKKYGLKADFLECKSTNCGNNITLLLELIKENQIPCQSVILSQDATMQRRMEAGLRKYVSDDVTIINFATYSARVVEKDRKLLYEKEIYGMWDMERYISLLLGEIPRLTDDENGYGPKGKNFIAHVDIPDNVKEAFETVMSSYSNLMREANPLYAKVKK